MRAKINNFLQYIKLVDIFGIKTEFLNDRKTKFQTLSGTFFTIIYFSSVIILFFVFGADMINRKSPEASISQALNINPSPALISPSSYFFIFGLEDCNSIHFVDESIYIPHLYQSRRNQTTMEEDFTLIPVEPCSEELLPADPNLRHYFSSQAIKLSDMYCISNDPVSNGLTIEGAWDQDKFTYLWLSIEVCRNKSDCQNETLIREKLHTSYFNFLSTDYFFDMQNFEEPAKVFGRNYFIETSETIKKILTWDIERTIVNSDEGWFLNAFSSNSYFTFKTVRESFELSSDLLIDMSIRRAIYETGYTRKYKKVQNVLAEMTGFLQLIFTILYIVSSPLVKKEYLDSLINSIYNFEVDERSEHRKKSPDMIKSFKTMIQEGKDNLNGKAQVLDPKNKTKKDNKLIEFLMKVQETPLKMSLCELLRSFISKRDNEVNCKRRQRNKGISTIFSQLDIKFLLEKFAELEKLKMLILDEDQYHLFEYLPKRRIKGREMLMI